MKKYLTKSLFTHALDCPTKLYYKSNSKDYVSSQDDDDFLRSHSPPLSSDSSEFTEYDVNLPVFGQMEPDDSSSEPYAQNLLQQIALEQINDDD